MRLSRNVKIFIFFAVIVGITIPFLTYNYETQNPIIWEVSIYGNVTEEVTIPYEALANGTYGLIEDRTFYYKNSFGTEEYHTVTGPSLWHVLNQTGVLRGNSTQVYFRSVDNYETGTLDIAEVEAHPEYAVLAFKYDGEILKPKSEGGDGPIRGVVDFNLTTPDTNTGYWAKYLNQIIII